MTIEKINIGGAPNDGTGQPLRSGGQVINDNFAELDSRTVAAQIRADKGVSDAATAQAKADAAIPGSAAGVSIAQLVDGRVPASQLPGSVDNVLEFPAREGFPVVGASGKIYIAINDGDSTTNPTRQWRWSGTAYVLIPSSPGSTDQVPEGQANLYFNAGRVRSTLLAGLGAVASSAITAGDSILQAFAKIQGQLNDKLGRSETAADSSKLEGRPASFYTTPMTGATSTSPGTTGLVPAPGAGDQTKVLSGAGTYIEAGGAGLPVGAVIPWTLPEALIPGGMIPRNGQLLSRATWPQLWTLVSASAVTDTQWTSNIALRGCYSSGDGSTTFRMPDDNGKHPDGLGVGAVTYRGYGKNSTGTVGVHQADQLQGFNLGTGAFRLNAYNTNYPSANASSVFRKGVYLVNRPSGDPADLDLFSVTDGVNGVPRAGTETRMANSTAIWVTVGATKASNAGAVDVTALATEVASQSSRSDIAQAIATKAAARRYTTTELLWSGNAGSNGQVVTLNRPVTAGEMLFVIHGDVNGWVSNCRPVRPDGRTRLALDFSGANTYIDIAAGSATLTFATFTAGYPVSGVYSLAAGAV